MKAKDFRDKLLKNSAEFRAHYFSSDTFTFETDTSSLKGWSGTW